ncbi:tubulin epsilon and delta complex protein 1 isoform X3 [Zonotrichia albicollis]|uniref:tubulin epsilon and delta complex protein 1 isoform X3 n=1 Tax=Zonotrichia albicollis TaxID=44394 RepID=UPI000393CC60|nr:tubulin epsilon and delta complex protein 1 isoform X1 [Zonotrichia albicollis]
MRGRQREQPRVQPREQQRQRGPALSAAVGALCRALPPHARPAPDTLRRARFDRPQASLDFWKLLYVLLKQIHGGSWTESDAIGAQVRFVQWALWYHGYRRPQLRRLPADGSVGSRELLLAFSWLLHCPGLLQRLLAHNRVQTGDHTSVCTCEDDVPERQEGPGEAGPEGRVDVRYLQWLHGRLRLQWCSLHAQHQEQCRLLHKIHSFTSGSHMDQNLGHFSVTEADLIRHPENYKQLLQLLESETTQLEAFLEWKQLEPVYWQWMETVLDDMAEEGNMCVSQDADVEKRRLPEVTSCCPWAARLAGQMDRLSRDLLALQEQLHQLVAQRKAAWWEKVAAREELQKERFSATARKAQESTELKLRGLPSLCAPQKTRMHGLCRLVLRSKQPASKVASGQCVSKEAAAALRAAEVIRELQLREASLQRELQQLQQQCRTRLDGIAEGLEGVICISP